MKLIEEIRAPIETEIRCRSKFKKWAYDNAYTLAFLAIFFGLTWIVIMLVGLWEVAHVQ